MDLAAIRALAAEHPIAWDVAAVAIILLVCLLADLTVKQVLLRGLKKIFNAVFAGGQGKNLLLEFAARLANIAPAIVLYFAPGLFPGISAAAVSAVEKISIALIGILLVLCVNKLLDIVDALYQQQPNADARPIKGFLQLAKIILGIAAVIFIAANLLDKSPVILLSGLGAAAAVLMLIFQDTILSLVASIQLNSNNMVKIGDWITMPACHADGVVIEAALHTVKVQNWDMTIVALPTRKLVGESFTNWRGMFEAGGRRIKRSLSIDQRSVRFLTDTEVINLADIPLLKGCLDLSKTENEKNNPAPPCENAPGGRQLTNFGVFRIYTEKYLRSRNDINQEMTLLVRPLDPGSTGAPLEVYCFTRSTQWAEHENVQAEIFEHLLAILPMFGLRVFQRASGIYQEEEKSPGNLETGSFPRL